MAVFFTRYISRVKEYHKKSRRQILAYCLIQFPCAISPGEFGSVQLADLATPRQFVQFSSDAISTDKLDFLSWHKIVNGGRGSSISHVMEASGCPTKAHRLCSVYSHASNKSSPLFLSCRVACCLRYSAPGFLKLDENFSGHTYLGKSDSFNHGPQTHEG